MGWNVTSHEGKICYERDGMRVYRTQDIEAIERQEKVEAEQRNNNVRCDYHEDECENTDIDEMKPATALVIVALAIAAILCFMFGVGN